jgi:hypothetical protein
MDNGMQRFKSVTSHTFLILCLPDYQLEEKFQQLQQETDVGCFEPFPLGGGRVTQILRICERWSVESQDQFFAI